LGGAGALDRGHERDPAELRTAEREARPSGMAIR
jgi:hypothetical protein